MTTKDKHNDSERFVTQHYEHGRFDEDAAWKRLGIGGRRSHRWGIVAAASVAAVLTVSACIYFMNMKQNVPTVIPAESTVAPTTKPVTAQNKIEVIEFSDAPLTDVVSKIEEVYGVRIENVPTEEYRLTLRYEGTAADLVSTINDILETNLIIAE